MCFSFAATTASFSDKNSTEFSITFFRGSLGLVPVKLSLDPNEIQPQETYQ